MRFVFAACLLLLALPAQAADWWAAETDHFIVKSQDSEEETRQFAEDLERFDAAMRFLQDLPGAAEASPSTKLIVYRFGTDADIARLFGDSDSGVAGFFISHAGNSVAYVPAKKRINTQIKTRTSKEERLDELTVLRHEYTHYFMMQHFPAAYPRWYVEGYAELMATIRFNEDGSFFVGDPPLYRSFQLTELPQTKLEEMLDSKHKLSGLDAYQHYATGWLLTHYLNFEPTRYNQLREYLTALGNGEDSLAAARRIFGDLDAIDKILRKYIRGPFPGLNVKPDTTEIAVSTRRLGGGEVALIREEMRMGRGVDDKQAKDLVADARANIVGFEQDYDALKILAQAETWAENYDEADRLGEKLTEMNPDRIEGWLIRSDAAIERIEDDPAQAALARTYAASAAARDRNDPRALINYYYAYVEAGETPPEQAIIALETAFDHAGSDTGYRILLARQLVTEDRMGAALSVLLPIAFEGHGQGDKEIAEEDKSDEPSLGKLLRLVNAGDRDGAIAMMDKMFDDEEEDEGKGG